MGAPHPNCRWWSGVWMSDELLIEVAKEEGWRPETACSARDAAVWCNANGRHVYEFPNEKGQA